MKPMRHAYLIIAHEAPEVLDRLLMEIDDCRNDIYVHIDIKAPFAKAEYCPKHARITYLEHRFDGRWGDFSLVEIELALLRTALNKGDYGYLHLVSGVDLPVKTQDFIHDCCNRMQGTLFIGYAQNVSDREIWWRSQHRFLFSRSFRSKSIVKRGLRTIVARIQSIFKYHRYPGVVRKGAQWWSITSEFGKYLIDNEKDIKRYFEGTYCPDELVVQTYCWNSSFRDFIYDANNEFEGCRRYIPWKNGHLRYFEADDFIKMKSEDYWFARKFDESDMDEYLSQFGSKGIK